MTFFYDNPLASNGHHARRDWFHCSCCPTNVGRLLGALPQYIANTSEDGVWVHQYISSKVAADVKGVAVSLGQTTDYPRSPEIKIQIGLAYPVRFTLHLRVPAWTGEPLLRINNTNVEQASRPVLPNGYLSITREWRDGDTVELTLPLTLRYVYARPEVGENAGRAALMRGPVVYCVEEADNGKNLAGVVSPPISDWREIPGTGIFKDFTLLKTDSALAPAACDENAPLYSDAPQALVPQKLVAIPYSLWNNRGPGEMRVWLRHG
ncbi:MAG: glycoside hydrolase family 127 protein [Kiritimatiellaeota bacterium]|nr:glycoside hydrolase family 127 protein [Kiritimatiellota bacterium]